MSDLTDREDLPYTSQAGLMEDRKASSKDEADLSTLKRVLHLINEAEARASDMNMLDTESKISVESQLVGYQFALNDLILPLKAMVQSAVNKVQDQNIE